MRTNITIGRQFGSGGREIGRKVAEHYGIPCYDKELINEVAKNSGFTKEIIKEQDEQATSSFLYNLVMDTYTFGYNAMPFTDMPISQKIFLAQFDTIKKLAKEEGPCVFIGRCADCALSEFPHVLNVFIHADMDYRIARAAEYPEFSEDIRKDPQRLKEMVAKMDRQRQSYYNYYSMQKWDSIDSYDLCIDSSFFGIDGAVKAIISAVDLMEEKE
ncbi:MAG: cytidylate kinase-like family protein [Lachnospiraceae bacterium]|nr:cytidylate kinase-like family protein [Lachnospiraceae bacterium]